MQLNQNFANLQESYLFASIAKKVNAFTKENPDKKVIRLGIGDVTLPLVPEVVKAMQQATCAMGVAETFKGYGEEQGYSFLRECILKEYENDKIPLCLEEIFISDGAKSDLANILDIFAVENTVLIPNPVYPVYVDTNIMAGRRIVFANGTKENNFLPMPDDRQKVDIIYLCSPNNPTGATYSLTQLQKWVDYALKNKAVILFDAAYSCFIQDENLPKSIYQIEEAKKCAIEFASFSKLAGFTGVRCGYTIVPQALQSDGMSCNQMWLRRQTTKFNGVAYIVQKGAEAVFSTIGKTQIQQNIAYYQQNANAIVACMEELKIWYTGGTNAPYIWLQCPKGMDSWQFFDYLLQEAQIVGTAGAGFGENGKNYFRLSAFGKYEDTLEAVNRLKKLFK